MGTICFTEINFKIFGDKIHVKRANYKIAICSIAFLVTFSHLRKFILVWWSFKEVWWSRDYCSVLASEPVPISNRGPAGAGPTRPQCGLRGGRLHCNTV